MGSTQRRSFDFRTPQPSPLQPTLFEPLPPMVAPAYVKGATIQEQFLAFHAANPHVYAELRRMAINLKRQGTLRYGIGGLFEVLRWRYAMQTTGSAFKLNNNWRSRFARLLMDNEPELADFFETRELQSA